MDLALAGAGDFAALRAHTTHLGAVEGPDCATARVRTFLVALAVARLLAVLHEKTVLRSTGSRCRWVALGLGGLGLGFWFGRRLGFFRLGPLRFWLGRWAGGRRNLLDGCLGRGLSCRERSRLLTLYARRSVENEREHGGAYQRKRERNPP